jgi:putative transposase
MNWAFGPWDCAGCISRPQSVRPDCWLTLKMGDIEGMIHAMPQSLSLVVLHIIFSTKDRRPLLDPAMRPRLHAYFATVAHNAECHCYRAGGVADHVHLAVRLSRTLAIADLMQNLKTASSKWLKAQSPDLRTFAWQRGYGCFSVGPSDLDSLCAYIDKQQEHHQTRSFQEEFLMFLKKYRVEYDEAYVWD